MPRKLRLEEVGGLYHVINRGNYRYPVFHSVGAAAAFEQTLWDTLGRFNWRLHGYALMPNHFHLAVETPIPNLAAGMNWLECTYATRFNRFRSERGHVFQVEPLPSAKCTQPWRINIADKLHAAGSPYAWLAKTLCLPKPNSLRVKLFRMHDVSM